MGEQAPGLARLHQVLICVEDVRRAARFYRDALGLRLLFEAPPNLAFFDCGGVRLMLAPAEGRLRPGGTVLYFGVDDIHHMRRTLAARGVSFRGEPHRIATLADREVWLAEFADGEGNTFALISEPPLRAA
jgi:methylmalonyl-CoA/ethylmalonyl-CoA epimerase